MRVVVVHRGVVRAIAEILTGEARDEDKLELGGTLEHGAMRLSRGDWCLDSPMRKTACPCLTAGWWRRSMQSVSVALHRFAGHWT